MTEQLGVHLSIFVVSSVDIQGVSLSYLSRAYLQGVSLSTACSTDIKGVSFSTFNVLVCQNAGLYGVSSQSGIGMNKNANAGSWKKEAQSCTGLRCLVLEYRCWQHSLNADAKLCLNPSYQTGELLALTPSSPIYPEADKVSQD